MQTNQNSKFQQKRRFLIILPLLTLPFLTLTFWALGGGTQSGSPILEKPKQGFNLELPGISDTDEKSLDKLGHYQRSSADSTRFLQEVKNDPYYKMAYQQGRDLDSQAKAETADLYYISPGQNTIPFYSHPQEEQILQRLEALNQTLTEKPNPTPALTSTLSSTPSLSSPFQSTPNLSTDLDRLDQMMQQMQNTQTGPDPEFEQMAELLDKILDIQHPERVQERLHSQKEKQESSITPQVTGTSESVATSLDVNLNHESQPTQVGNGFYGLEDSPITPTATPSIRAVIHEDQSLVSGATVKLRLLENIQVQGITIPKDQLIYGIASLNGERLKIAIQHIRMQDQILSVDLRTHDADGLEGIRIPGTISQEVSSQQGSRTIQSLGLSTFDNSLESQAATAGIETAKSFLGKKIKQVKVNLKAGYQVWLIENN